MAKKPLTEEMKKELEAMARADRAVARAALAPKVGKCPHCGEPLAAWGTVEGTVDAVGAHNCPRRR